MERARPLLLAREHVRLTQHLASNAQSPLVKDLYRDLVALADLADDVGGWYTDVVKVEGAS